MKSGKYLYLGSLVEGNCRIKLSHGRGPFEGQFYFVLQHCGLLLLFEQLVTSPSIASVQQMTATYHTIKVLKLAKLNNQQNLKCIVEGKDFCSKYIS